MGKCSLRLADADLRSTQSSWHLAVCEVSRQVAAQSAAKAASVEIAICLPSGSEYECRWLGNPISNAVFPGPGCPRTWPL